MGTDKLDQLVKTIPSRPTSSQTSARPRSAAVVTSSDTKSNNFLGVGDNDDRPAVLRREKTFDLSDNSNNQQQQQKSKGTHHHNSSKLIDIQLDTERYTHYDIEGTEIQGTVLKTFKNKGHQYSDFRS